MINELHLTIILPTLLQEAARKMMHGVGCDGLEVDGRRLFFEYRYV